MPVNHFKKKLTAFKKHLQQTVKKILCKRSKTCSKLNVPLRLNIKPYNIIKLSQHITKLFSISVFYSMLSNQCNHKIGYLYFTSTNISNQHLDIINLI